MDGSATSERERSNSRTAFHFARAANQIATCSPPARRRANSAWPGRSETGRDDHCPLSGRAMFLPGLRLWARVIRLRPHVNAIAPNTAGYHPWQRLMSRLFIRTSREKRCSRHRMLGHTPDPNAYARHEELLQRHRGVGGKAHLSDDTMDTDWYSARSRAGENQCPFYFSPVASPYYHDSRNHTGPALLSHDTVGDITTYATKSGLERAV